MGLNSSQQNTSQFLSYFKTCQNGLISRAHFLDYYRDIGSVIQGDQAFEDLLAKTWGFPLFVQTVPIEEIRKWVKLIREKLIVYTKGIQDELKLMQIHASFSKTHSNVLNIDDFDNMLLSLNLEVPKDRLRGVFNGLDWNHSGSIEFDDFQKTIMYNPYP